MFALLHPLRPLQTSISYVLQFFGSSPRYSRRPWTSGQCDDMVVRRDQLPRHHSTIWNQNGDFTKAECRRRHDRAVYGMRACTITLDIGSTNPGVGIQCRADGGNESRS